jgi:hypothetical protein
MRNVRDKSRTENQNTRFIFSNFFFFLENRAVYEIMWKNIVEPDRPQMTVWSMRIACWIPKAPNTHTEYVTLTPFPLQQWLLRYTYIACLVSILGLQKNTLELHLSFSEWSLTGGFPPTNATNFIDQLYVPLVGRYFRWQSPTKQPERALSFLYPRRHFHNCGQHHWWQDLATEVARPCYLPVYV